MIQNQQQESLQALVPKQDSLLKFQTGGNAKLDKKITAFNLPAGKTCPGARACNSRCREIGGARSIVDGPHCEFRCFAATAEAAFPDVYIAREWNRLILCQYLKTKAEMTQRILDSLPPRSEVFRVHAGGDFFNQTYFDAWLDVARARPKLFFYAYTKSLPFWVARLNEMPNNLLLTASYGGHFDHLIEQHKLRHSIVVDHPDAAAALGLEIDHDDSHAYTRSVDSFALLLHGIQPKGSAAAIAIKRMQDEEVQYAYTK